MGERRKITVEQAWRAKDSAEWLVVYLSKPTPDNWRSDIVYHLTELATALGLTVEKKDE